MILNGLPWKCTEIILLEIILLFLRLHPSTAFWTLLLIMMGVPFPLRDVALHGRYNSHLS